MSGQWPPYYDQASHSFQASEIADYPDTKKPCHTTKLDSKALGSPQSRASPTGHYKQPREEHDTSESLRCEWKDCDYLGTFTNEGTLVRHVRTVHVSPYRFNCTICGKRFGRKDRYRTHRQMAHSQDSVRE
ncbi:uncharacterized protein N7469_008569 [Penicillium citrinum]|uniref:C2H2-type domain-containing protein n=1 Tax=Penicillium citrinum TaxID=5077 RepID=A0A9W9NLV9_PENCI|nr:uncharacterized protein N7469_008569 [Penicillium citrinum]KAJ5222329.1 hypothetical protein N7469_008569 [Penicillium citrinum]